MHNFKVHESSYPKLILNDENEREDVSSYKLRFN